MPLDSNIASSMSSETATSSQKSVVEMTILGSGSKGNCTFIQAGSKNILIDAGFSGKQISERLSKIGKKLDEIHAIFITHEHSDHTVGLTVLANRHQIPIYCTLQTSDHLRNNVSATYNKWNIFKAGDNIILEDVIVETLSVPHDAYDPVALIIHHSSASLGFFTDLGYVPRLVLEKARKCTALLLESNYDVKMLQADTKRPWAVKQRIQARHGHLSNEAACQFLREVVSEKLRYLLLGHLSADCNCPNKVRELFENELRQLNRLDIQLHVAEQHAVSPTLKF